MPTEYANRFFHLLLSGIESETFKIVLMQDGFTFNRDDHHVYADISGSELATGNGYTRNTKVMENASLVEDDASNSAILSFDNAVWTASGGAIGPVSGAIIFVDSRTDDPIMKWIECATPQTIESGAPFIVQDNDIILRGESS